MISCPLCCQSQFSSIDLLRTTLINAIHSPFMCPLCNEMQHGLDNLAAHLSKHSEVVCNSNQIETHSIDVNNAIHIQNQNQPNQCNSVHNDVGNNIDQTNYCENQEIHQQIQSYSECVNNLSVEHMTEKAISSSPSVLDQKLTQTTIENDIDTGHQEQQPHQQCDIIQVFFCHLCACTFRSLELQQLHLQLVHEVNVNQIEMNLCEARNIQPMTFDKVDSFSSNLLECNLCLKRFKMIGSLRLHVRMVHGVSHVPQKIRSPRNKSISSLSPKQNNGEESAGDSITIGTSSSTGGANIPFNDNHEIVNEDADNDEAGYNKNKETDDRTHECDICNKRFTTKYFLKKHKRIHTGEKLYTCELCNRNFTFQQSYHRHLSYHTNDRPHICSICGRAFKESSTLYNHQRIHSGEKPFECETCGKCFRQRVSYLGHRRIHTGAMPYDCVTCDRKFRYKISLRTHKCTGIKETDPAHVNDNNDYKDDTLKVADANDHQTTLCSEQALDEFITESCNRLGIADHSGTNQSIYPCENIVNSDQTNQSTTFVCDSFNLNDLTFGDGETVHTDLANVTPSMSEIFPQTMDILNALYENV